MHHIFEQNLKTISGYPIKDGQTWYAFCDFVAAVGAGEIVNNPLTPATSAIQQNPQRLILAITRLRNSGFRLLSTVPVQQLTAPPNHFSSLISTLKIYGAHQTANAVKGSALTFWRNIESQNVTASSVQESTRSPFVESETPIPASSPRQIVEDFQVTLDESQRSRASKSRSGVLTLGLSAATVAGLIWYLNKRDSI